MRHYRHGLFIGKFYPPHRGHHDVIRTAAEQCRAVTVVVMASVAETIDLADRVAWLRTEHADSPIVRVVGIRCDAPVDVGDDRVWIGQLALIRAAVRSRTGENSTGESPTDGNLTADPVDAVFSADGYGRELADRLRGELVQVERSFAATDVRRDLAAAWPLLAAGTRAGMTTRVIVLGAESTGTTTVSRMVAEHYRGRGGVWSRTEWVGEYGRDYTETKWTAQKALASGAGRPEPALEEVVWDRDDFDRVAGEQTAREQRAAENGSPLLVCDTDAFATSIWERRYLGAQARVGPDWARAPRLPARHLYLLTDHRDVPWLDDGLREGDLEIRAAMTGWFEDALTAAGHSWVLLSGSLSERVELAIRAVDQVLAERMRFGTPFSGPGFEAGR